MNLHHLPDAIRRHADATIKLRMSSGALVNKTYADLQRDIDTTQALLRNAGLGEGASIGLFADNCYQWIVLDLACIELHVILIAFSSETVTDTADIIIKRHALSLLFTDNPPALGSGEPRIVSIADLLQLTTLPRTQTATAAVKFEPDALSVCFSSGSTGIPKGMIVSRAGADFIIDKFIGAFGLSGRDCIYIFLPLHNYQQRLLVYASLLAGAGLAFTTNKYLLQDFALFKPTFLVAPPGLFKNVLHLYGLQQASGATLQDIMGGRMRFFLVGMAPVEPQVIEQFQANGMLLLEAYGLSETGTIAWNTRSNNKTGSVGQPLDREEIIFSEDGELLVKRRHPLCIRYLEQSTDNIFRADGVIATGDLGHLDDDGFLVLTGRKKNIVVTTSGHKFQPELLEQRINSIVHVNASVVFHSRKNQCNVAIINVTNKPDSQLLQSIQQKIDGINVAIPAYQKISKILVNDDVYSNDNKLLTSNQKLNRSSVIEKYAADL